MIMCRISALVSVSLCVALSLNAPAQAAEQTYLVRSACVKAARCFATVQAALDAAAANPDGRVTIDIAPGVYHEKLVIERPQTTLRGHGASQTRIVFNAVAETAGHYHRNHWGTPGSATVTVDSDDVTIDGLTIENSYDFLANDALSNDDPKKISNSQGVALLADIHSDRLKIIRSAVVGYQDTLFANGKRVWVRDSLISGNVDFIFGNGEVLIENSEIRSRRRAAAFAPGEFQSFVTAPSTPLSQKVGIVIYHSRLTREAGVPDDSVALGRPWHPTTTFPDGRYADPNAVGEAVFLDCFMDAHISPRHWAEMAGTARDGTKTARFLPEDSRFYESNSKGPGARRADQDIKWKGGPDIAALRAIFMRDGPNF
jgi:pectinesterase